MPFNWYFINTYSGQREQGPPELLQRIKSMSQEQNVKEIVVRPSRWSRPERQKVQTEKRSFGYVW